MHKNKRIRLIETAVLLLIISLLLTTCDLFQVGLGESVDVVPPELIITSPGNDPMEYMRDDFVFSGTVTDDIQVKSVLVKWSGNSLPAVIDGTNWTITMPFANIEERGQILFEVTAVDTAGKTTIPITRTVAIDDAHPTVIVKAPQIYDPGPENSNYILIEGEAWDESPITSVNVEIYDPSNLLEPLVTQAADGDRTWSTRVLLTSDLGFVNSKSYLYNVVVQDKAGNLSDHLYHSSDFWSRLPAGTLFPTMGDLGMWDQYGQDLEILNSEGNEIFTEAVKYEMRISSIPSDLELDFTFNSDKDKPHITLSSLDPDKPIGENTLGQNVPIYASATDDKEGIDEDSVNLRIIQDNSENPAKEDVDLTVEASNFNAPGDGLYSSFQFDLSGDNFLAPGQYTGRLTAADKKGISTTLNFAFLIDKGAPGILSITPASTYAGVDSEGNIEIRINIKDDNPGAQVTGEASGTDGTAIAGVTSSILGSETELMEEDETTYRSTYAVTIPGPVPDELDVEITVEDSSHLKNTRSISYTVDRDKPEVEITVPGSGDIISGTAFTAAGSATDSGSNVYQVFLSLFEGIIATPLSGTTWIPAEGNTTWSLPFTLTDYSEGDFTLFAKAFDVAGNEGDVGRVSFYYDLANPEITINQGTGKEYRTGNFTLDGNISDSNEIEDINIKIAKDGGEFVEASGYPESVNNQADAWSYSMVIDADGTDDGTYEFEFTVADIAGKSKTLTKTIVVDTTPPDLVVSNLADGDSVNTSSYTIQGLASDFSGILNNQIRYQLNGSGSWPTIDVERTGNWELNVSGLTEGDGNSIIFSATDINGSVTTLPTIAFGLDLNPPSLNITNKSTFDGKFIATDFSLSGTASDVNGIKRLEISYDAGASYQAITTTPASTSNNTVINWNQDITIPANGANDGLKSMRIKAIDQYNKETIENISVTFDSSAPTFNVNNLANGQLLTTLNFTAKGTWSDNGGSGTMTGLAKMEYSLDNSTWLPLGSTVTNWTDTMIFPGQGLDQKAYVRATDAIGNISTIEEITVDIDTVLPESTVLQDGSLDWTNVYKTGAFTLSGTASDDNGISAVGISASDGSTIGTLTLNGADGDTSRTWSLNIIPDTQGTISYTVTVTDSASRTQNIVKSLVFDNIAPDLSVTNLLSGSTTFINGSSFTIRGVASDVTSGIKTNSIKYQENNDGNWLPITTFALSWAYEVDSLTEGGGQEIKFLVEDNAGNTTTSEDFQIEVDLKAPQAIITLPAEAALTETRNDISFSGTADDAEATPGRQAATATLSYSKNGGSAITVTAGTDANEFNWNQTSGSWAYTLPSTTLGDGLYVYTLTVTDSASKVSTATRTIQVDRTAPTLIVSSPLNNESTSSSTFLLKGTTRDTGGVGFDGVLDVEYSADSTDGADGNWEELSISGLDWEKDDYNLGATEGAFTFWFRSRDKLNNQALVGPLNVYLDFAAPVLSATGTTDTTYTKASTWPLSGGLTDSNAVHATTGITITATLDGGDIAAPAIDSYVVAGDNKSAAWSSTPVLSTDGLYVFTITGKDAAGKTHSTQRTVRRDNTAPTVVPNPLSGWKNGEITVSGTATDTGGSNLDTVEYRILDSTSAVLLDWTEANGNGSWSINIDTDTLDETVSGAHHSIEFIAYDKAANMSTVEIRTLQVDRAAPRATEMNYSTTLIQTKSDILFSGIADDDLIAPGAPVRIAGNAAITYSKDGAAAETVTAGTGVNEFNWNSATGSWEWTMPTSLGDGLYVITLTVADAASKPSTVTRTVQIDTTAPEVSISNPAPNESSSAPTYTINGMARDSGGVGFDGTQDVQFSLDPGTAFDDDKDDVRWTTMGSLEATSNWTAADVSLGTAEGTKILKVRAFDELDNRGDSSVTFYYDKATPSFTESGIASTDTQYTNSSIVFRGSAADTNALSAIKVSISGSDTAIPLINHDLSLNAGTDIFSAAGHGFEDGDEIYITGTTLPTITSGSAIVYSTAYYVVNTLTDSFQISDAPGGAALLFDDAGVDLKTSRWTHTFDTGVLSDGIYTLVFTATDAAQKTANVTRTAAIDTTIPEVNLSAGTTALDDVWQHSTTISLSGTAADTDGSVKSGVASVEYSTTGGTSWTPLTGTTGWSGSITLPESDGNSLTFRSIDKAGNISNVSGPITIKVDAQAPSLSETVPVTAAQTNVDLDFSGTINDNLEMQADAADAFKVLRKKDGISIANGTASYTAPVGVTPGAWSYTQEVADSDGVWELSFVATDASGLETTITKSFVIDTTAPTLVVDKPVNNESSLSSDYTISGSSRDAGGVGFDNTADVEYRYMGDETWSDWSAWTEIELDGINWEQDVSLIASEADLSVNGPDLEGTKKFQFRTTDKLDNTSSSPELTLYYDKNPPEIAVNGTTDTRFTREKVDFTGTASDSNELSTLQVSINEGTSDSIPVAPDDSWSYSVGASGSAADTELAEGLYNLVFTAIDVAGKTRVITRSVRIDTTAPFLSGITNLGFNPGWTNSLIHQVSGTAADTDGSGVASVEYSLDNSNWSPFSGTETFSSNITFSSGVNTLYVRATDKAGNIESITSQTVNIDTVNPEIELTTPSPDTTEKVNGQNDLAVVFDFSDDLSLVQNLYIRTGVNDFAPHGDRITAILNTPSAGEASAVIPASMIEALTGAGVSGQRMIYAQAVDDAGNSFTMSFPVYVDKQLPSAAITSHSEGSVVNETITMEGTASDTQGLSDVAIQYFDSTWIDFADQPTVDELYSWAIDVDTTGFTDDADLPVRVVATDEAGNVNTNAVTLSLSQVSDRPVLSLNNVDVSDVNSVLKLSRTIYGTVNDDDGSIANIDVSVDGSIWTSRSVSGGSWSYDIPPGQDDGEITLYFRLDDAAGKTFVSEDAVEQNRPRIVEDSEAAEPVYLAASTVGFRLDTVTPEIRSDIYIARGETTTITFPGTPDELTAQMPIGGVENNMKLRVYANDANEIKSFSVAVEGHADSPFEVTTKAGDDGVDWEIWESDAIPLTNAKIGDGLVDLVISITDKSDLTTTMTRTIRVDNSLPTVTYDGPFDTVYGEITVRGQASGEGSNLSSLEYQLGYNSDLDPAAAGWTPVTSDLRVWDIPFEGTAKTSVYAGLEVAGINASTDLLTVNSHGFSDDTRVWVGWHGSGASTNGFDRSTDYYVINSTVNTFQLSTTEGGVSIDLTDENEVLRISQYSRNIGTSGIWDLPIYFKAVDDAGNIFITTDPADDYNMNIDPTGDIPKITVIYPDPDSDPVTLGGNVRIFGSAEDNVTVDSVYMQISEDENNWVYTDDNAVDWYNGGNGIQASGTMSWNNTINTAGEFNPTGDDPRAVYFRVRVKDGEDNYSDWTEAQLLYIDDDVPVIGADPGFLEIVQRESDSPGGTIIATKDYVSNTWIRGNWFLTGDVVDDSGIKEIIVSDTTGTLGSSLSTSPFYEPTWFQSYDDGGLTQYHLNVPIAASNGTKTFTIEAIEDIASNAKSSMTTISLQHDNTAPTPAAAGYAGSVPVVNSNQVYRLSSGFMDEGSGFGRVAFYFQRGNKVYMPMAGDSSLDSSDTDVEQINGLYYLQGTAASRTDRSLTDAGLIGNAYARIGGVIRIGGVDHDITGWNSGTGTIEWADEVDTSFTEYHLAYAMFVNNQGRSEYLTDTSDPWGGIEYDDGDGMLEKIDSIANDYTWESYIDSKNIPDGPVTLYWVSSDSAGNYTTESLATSISNNRPRIASVTLGTDLTGEGLGGIVKETPYPALDPDGTEVDTSIENPQYGGAPLEDFQVASENFVAKGLTTVEIEVVGGNGALFYTLESDGSRLHNGTGAPYYLNDLPGANEPDANFPGGAIQLRPADLTTIGEGSGKSLDFVIWDSTETTTPGLDSSSANLTVPLEVDQVDEISPVVAMEPFYWNSDTDNSLYDNSRTNGHIELTEDLPPATFNEATGLMDTDPKVSGGVSFRGTAYDDQRLTSLWMAIDDFGFTAADDSTTDFDTNANGTVEVLGTTYSRVAAFSGGSWSGTDEWDTQGWKFSVTEEYLNQSGHKVDWQLDWDSARIANTVALDLVAKIIAVDKRGGDPVDVGYVNTNASSETDNATGDITTNNQPSYRFDVVPYITGLSTDGTGIRDQNIRGASGKYAIQYSNDGGDAITINGFNLAAVTNGVRIGSDTDGIDGAVLQGESLTIISESSTAVTVRKNATGSGYVSLVSVDVTTSAFIPSLNNINMEVDYNDEPSSEQVNPNLTDDRFITVFDVYDTGFTNGYWHEMLMNGDYPVFGHIYDSAADDLQFSRGEVTGESGLGGTATTSMTGLIRGLGFQYYAMARDAGGIYHQISSSTFNSMQQYYIYGEYATDYTGNFGPGYTNYGGATQVYWGGFTGDRAESAGNDALVLDELDYTPSLLVGRYKNPRLLVTGDSTAASDASLYMSFFDSNTGEIIYRNMQVGPSPNGGITTSFRDTGGVNMGELTNVTAGDNTRHTATSSASQYYDMGLTDDNVVVIVYYNQAQSRLELVYSTDSAGGTTAVSLDGANPTADVYFSDPVTVGDQLVGSYMSMAIETDGNPATDDPIHIAAHDSDTADLFYIRIPSYDKTDLTGEGTPGVTTDDIEQVTVDAKNTVGIWTDIAVQNSTPYIGYYNSSLTGTKDSVKVAWFLGDAATEVTEGYDENGVTGNWEFYTVPANQAPEGGIVQFSRVSVGFDTSGNPVVGYLADDLEYARILPNL